MGSLSMASGQSLSVCDQPEWLLATAAQLLSLQSCLLRKVDRLLSEVVVLLLL